MGSKANCSLDWIVNGVVVDEDWHSKNVHWQVGGHDEQKTLGLVLIYGHNIVLRFGFNPPVIDHEEQAWEFTLAVGEHLVIGEGPVNIRNLFHDLGQVVLEVEGRDHDRSRASVNDGVEGVVHFSVVGFDRGPAIAVLRRSVTDSDTLHIGTPEEVLLNHLELLHCGVFSDVIFLWLTEVDPRELAWLREVERELVSGYDPLLVQMLDIERPSGVAGLSVDVEGLITRHTQNTVDGLPDSGLILDQEVFKLRDTG